MDKLKIAVTIHKNGHHGYVCTCSRPFPHFDLGGCGATVREAQADLLTFYNEMKELHPTADFPELDIMWTHAI